LLSLKREEKRLAEGWVYEPSSLYRKNPAASLLKKELPLKAKVKAHSGLKQPVPVLRSKSI